MLDQLHSSYRRRKEGDIEVLWLSTLSYISGMVRSHEPKRSSRRPRTLFWPLTLWIKPSDGDSFTIDPLRVSTVDAVDFYRPTPALPMADFRQRRSDARRSQKVSGNGGGRDRLERRQEQQRDFRQKHAGKNITPNILATLRGFLRTLST
jgi:hypothetical protein